MKPGKIPNEILKSLILDKLNIKRPEIIIRPGVGEDCTAIDFGSDVCILSSDPVTGAIFDTGALAVHVSCNDIASAGVQPFGIMVTILAPPETTEEMLGEIMKQIIDTAASIEVEVIGGHTEITEAVNRVVISTTAIGKAGGRKIVKTSGAKPGDDVIMTKTAGLEGTAIIAKQKYDELAGFFGKDIINKAVGFINAISVVKEGIISGEFGVNSMHDVTEGGILGALWEVSEASGAGIEIFKDLIPVADETIKITKYFGIDPLRLISSGCMLITCKNGDALLKKLEAEGVPASIIGRMTKEKTKYIVSGNSREMILPPGPDELFSVI